MHNLWTNFKFYVSVIFNGILGISNLLSHFSWVCITMWVRAAQRQKCHYECKTDAAFIPRFIILRRNHFPVNALTALIIFNNSNKQGTLAINIRLTFPKWTIIASNLLITIMLSVPLCVCACPRLNFQLFLTHVFLATNCHCNIRKQFTYVGAASTGYGFVW